MQEIVLTQEEDRLLSFFMQCLGDRASTVTLRVAGGWVRDKLLGKVRRQ